MDNDLKHFIIIIAILTILLAKFSYNVYGVVGIVRAIFFVLCQVIGGYIGIKIAMKVSDCTYNKD